MEYAEICISGLVGVVSVACAPCTCSVSGLDLACFWICEVSGLSSVSSNSCIFITSIFDCNSSLQVFW